MDFFGVVDPSTFFLTPDNAAALRMSKALTTLRAEYQQLAENITLLETSYFGETAGVSDGLLPLGRAVQLSKRKEPSVRREQRVFSLSSTACGAWPEAAHTVQELASALAAAAMRPSARRRKRAAEGLGQGAARSEGAKSKGRKK